MGEAPARGDQKSQKSQRTAPIWAEFDAEIIALERGVARAAQAIALFGVVIAIYVALAIAPSMGRALGVASFGGFLWYTFVRTMLARGAGVRALRWINPVVELTIPAGALVIIAKTQGAAYALGSWVPPLLFAVLIFLSIMRLKPAMPLLLSLVGAVEYLVIYAVVLRSSPMLGYIDGALYRAPMQGVRAASIIVFGALGMLASAGLRRAIGQAARQTRAKEIFGKYRIGKLIASGGMGTVYEALYCPEGGFERKVALKRVHPHLAQDPSFVQSFRDEAELGARLAHPNIVAVFDFGREGETYFFAMEYVDGMDLLRLRKRCAAGHLPIPSRLVAFIGREIAEGLAFAHDAAQGADGRPLHVVHRDLNPSNVLISRTGQVKISDFGVAKALREASAHETRHLVGKLAYVSPEIARGAAFDPRADLFALGLVLWELLCLRAAFARDNDAATLNAVMSSVAPPPSLGRAELAGSGWDEVCATALQHDPARRFGSAREMSAALARILEHEGMPQAGELVAFLKTVEALPPPSAASAMAAADAAEDETTEAKTVREGR
jgi:serine/threonine-protein kinase